MSFAASEREKQRATKTDHGQRDPSPGGISRRFTPDERARTAGENARLVTFEPPPARRPQLPLGGLMRAKTGRMLARSSRAPRATPRLDPRLARPPRRHRDSLVSFRQAHRLRPLTPERNDDPTEKRTTPVLDEGATSDWLGSTRAHAPAFRPAGRGCGCTTETAWPDDVARASRQPPKAEGRKPRAES